LSDAKVILIVDDEPDTCTYFSFLLEDQGFTTICAANGEEGLAKVKEHSPILITLDMSMPEKSGVKLFRELKESDEWKDIPIIIITGISDDFKTFISGRSQTPPPEGYLSKPIDQEKFLTLVRDLTT